MPFLLLLLLLVDYSNSEFFAQEFYVQNLLPLLALLCLLLFIMDYWKQFQFSHQSIGRLKH